MTEKFGGRTVVIRALTGSHNYNLNTPQSDEDWKFFVCPSFEDLWNGNRFSNGKQSDDFDFTVHDVRQLSDLLWKANLNFVEVLFSKNFNPCGFEFPWFLLDNRDRLAHMHLRSFGFATLGMHNQKMGTLHKGTAKTQVAVDTFGFDTKDATHALRCLLVVERVANGMTVGEALWFDNDCPERQLLLDVKAGAVSHGDFLDLVDNWHATHFERVEQFFKAQEPDTEAKEMLDAETKAFVKGVLGMK